MRAAHIWTQSLSGISIFYTSILKPILSYNDLIGTVLVKAMKLSNGIINSKKAINKAVFYLFVQLLRVR